MPLISRLRAHTYCIKGYVAVISCHARATMIAVDGRSNAEDRERLQNPQLGDGSVHQRLKGAQICILLPDLYISIRLLHNR